jgi:hypothetical protein
MSLLKVLPVPKFLDLNRDRALLFFGEALRVVSGGEAPNTKHEQVFSRVTCGWQPSMMVNSKADSILANDRGVHRGAA